MSRPTALLTDAAARLGAAGVATPRVDAELLLAHVLDVPRSRLATAAPANQEQVTAFDEALQRRAHREPLQHITGRAPFRHLELAVGPGVFVPRPETELLIDAVLPELRGRPQPRAVDLCAGSGALALALAEEAPGTQVVAVELSPDASTWLRRNVTDSGVAGVTVVVGDVRDRELLAEQNGQVDVVVSNPPYVPAGTPVAPEVQADPSLAVFAGPDGLDLLPAVAACAWRLLRPGGWFAVEHGDDQEVAVTERLTADGWVDVVDHADLSGRSRFTTARRK